MAALQKTVAWIGLGAMGAPLAGRVASAISGVRVFDLDTGAIDRFHSQHSTAIPCASLEDAVAGADCVFSCLPKSEHVRSCVDQMLGAGLDRAALPGVWTDASSGDPTTSAELAAQLRDEGGPTHFVDCAVSGGPVGARAGTVAAMIGGDAGAYEEVEPIIDAFAGTQVHLGPPGAGPSKRFCGALFTAWPPIDPPSKSSFLLNYFMTGHATKAINNTLLAANLWTAAEGVLALTKLGVSAEKACAAISAGSGRSFATMQRFPDYVFTRKFDYGFALALHCKDIGIAMDLFDKTDSPAPVLRHVREMATVARRELGDDADHVEMVKMLEKWTGAELRP